MIRNIINISNHPYIVDILKAEADKRELTLESKFTMKEYAELISE